MTELKRSWISYPTQNGVFRALYVAPATPAPWPALIVVHGASGLDPSHQDVTEGFAKQGYLAVAPDIYTQDKVFQGFTLAIIEAGMELGRVLRRGSGDEFLAQFSADERDSVVNAYEWLEHRPEKTYIQPILACFEYLEQRSDIAAIGCIGFCMGGRLAAELAVSGADLAAGVIFYGIDPGVEHISKIRCPIQGHYGVTDKRITDRVPAFADAMKKAGKDFSYFIYEAGHGFANAPYLPMHNAEAAALAFERAYQFLARHVLSAAANKIEGAAE